MAIRKVSPEMQAAWAAAVRASRAWEKSTGPRTAAGKRKSALRAVRSELDSQAFTWAMAYVKAMTQNTISTTCKY